MSFQGIFVPNKIVRVDLKSGCQDITQILR